MQKSQIRVDRKGKNKYEDDYDDGSDSQNEEDMVHNTKINNYL